MRKIKGMRKKLEDNIWWIKYRPTTLNDYICTEAFREKIDLWMNGTNDSHLLFESSLPGTGKTSLAKIIAYNTSDFVKEFTGKDRGIDLIRDDIFNFVSKRSTKRKVVILDEFERMSLDAIKALISLTVDYAKHARFICTCNNLAEIKDPITRDAFKNRFQHVDFMKVYDTDANERNKMAMRMFEIGSNLLQENNIPFEKQALIQIIKRNFVGPTIRFRSIIQTLYEYSGLELTMDALQAPSLELTEILKATNKMDFKIVRSFIAENAGNARGILKELYNNMPEYFNSNNDNFGDVFIILNDCRRDLNDPEDPEIPLAALFWELSNMDVIR